MLQFHLKGEVLGLCNKHWTFGRPAGWKRLAVGPAEAKALQVAVSSTGWELGAVALAAEACKSHLRQNALAIRFAA